MFVSYLVLGSARTVIKCSSFLFNGRIRYGTKGEKVEERLLVNSETYGLDFLSCVICLVLGCGESVHLFDKDPCQSKPCPSADKKPKCISSLFSDRIAIQHPIYQANRSSIRFPRTSAIQRCTVNSFGVRLRKLGAAGNGGEADAFVVRTA